MGCRNLNIEFGGRRDLGLNGQVCFARPLHAHGIADFDLIVGNVRVQAEGMV